MSYNELRVFECYDYTGNRLDNYDPVRWIAAPTRIAAMAEASRRGWTVPEETDIGLDGDRLEEADWKNIGCDVVVLS